MTSRRNVQQQRLLPRPLPARSVIASLLLGRHPPAAPSSLLVRWCALFDISETAARVALTRMVQRGELESHDGVYSLRGRIRERQAEQEFALAPSLDTWDGSWKLAMTSSGLPAAERSAARRALEHLHMVPLRDGVWVRPDNLPHVPPRELRSCTWFRHAHVDEPAADAIVREFALGEYDRRTRELLRHLPRATEALPAVGAFPRAFEAGAATAQHLRRDPLVPSELLPRDWHADDLRREYDRYRRAFGAAIAGWSREV